jgi:hypothetical protein
MTPERIAAVVARWVRLYTRGMPEPQARRRIEEIDADLHDHIAHEREQGIADPRIARGIAARMVRGLPADVAWRRSAKEESMSRSAIRVALVTALILLVPLVATLTSDDAGWSVADFVFGGVLLMVTGLVLELAVKRPQSVALRLAAAVIGGAAIVSGEADDAPGLVLFGGLVILGTLVLAFRTAQRAG